MTNWSYLVARKSLWDVYGGDVSFVLHWSHCVTARTNSQLFVWAQMFWFFSPCQISVGYVHHFIKELI